MLQLPQPESTRTSSALLWLAATAGLLLSVMDLLGICTAACSETAKYTIVGLDFGWFGLGFFLLLLVLLALRRFITWLHLFLVMLLSGAAGAELYFIWLQKFVIGRWCPVCLSIATAVYLGTAVLLYETFRRKPMRENRTTAVCMLVALALGLLVSVFGVTKDAHATLDFYLGKPKSPVTVYFISDWFCPACQQIESRLLDIYARVSKDTRVAFIDFPIHHETSNFTPYNLQFLAFEKARYPVLREALSGLARKTRTPSPEEVQAAVAPHGVKLRQMNYADILHGMQLNLTTYRGFDVTATPSVVVDHAKTRKHKVLVGDKQITLQGVQAAIAEVSK